MREISATDLDWSDETTMSFEAASLIDRYSAFDGEFRAQRDLRVEGEIKGTVSCDGTLFIAEGASVAASVDAENVTVAGDLTGEIRCRGRLQILPSGRVRANVSTGALVIQEGAIYEGQLAMAGMERAAPRPLRARSASGPVSIEAAAGDRSSGNGTTYIRRLGSPEAPWESTGAADDAPEASGDPETEGPAG